MADQRSWYRVHGTRQAATLRLGGAAEDVGNEDVPGSVFGFQLSKRRIGNGEMEIIDIRSASTIAIRADRAKDLGGESPGTVGRERRLVGQPREAPRGLRHGRSVKRGGDVRDC